jgi:hypothetical protein
MNPLEKEILHKFSKQKVELALVEMFIKEVEELQIKSDNAIDEVIKVKSILQKSRQDINQVASSLKTLKTGQARIKKMYDELGIGLDPKIDKAMKKRLNVEFEAEELVKKLDSLIGMI